MRCPERTPRPCRATRAPPPHVGDYGTVHTTIGFFTCLTFWADVMNDMPFFNITDWRLIGCLRAEEPLSQGYLCKIERIYDFIICPMFAKQLILNF